MKSILNFIRGTSKFEGDIERIKIWVSNESKEFFLEDGNERRTVNEILNYLGMQ